MTLEWLLGWWNLIFLIPLGLSLAYLFAYALSGWTFGDADLDFDPDAEVDLDVDVDADIDAQVDVDTELATHGGRADIDADSDVGNARGVLAAFTPLGVGRVPLSIVMMVLALTFGMTGFASNQLLRNVLGENGVWISLPIAALLSFGVTSVVSHLIARYMPLNESSARPKSELVGRRGIAVFGIDTTSGVVAVSDAGGDRYQVAARVFKDKRPIPAGAEVILTRYEAEGGYFIVQESGLV